jgi:hypothetical protein
MAAGRPEHSPRVALVSGRRYVVPPLHPVARPVDGLRHRGSRLLRHRGQLVREDWGAGVHIPLPVLRCSPDVDVPLPVVAEGWEVQRHEFLGRRPYDEVVKLIAT